MKVVGLSGGGGEMIVQTGWGGECGFNSKIKKKKGKKKRARELEDSRVD